MKAFWIENYITTAIHEMTHLSSKASNDGALGQAALALGYIKKLSADPKSTDINDILKVSGDWDEPLRRYCGEKVYDK